MTIQTQQTHSATASTEKADFVIPLLLVLLDAIAIEAAFLFSYTLRFHTRLFDTLGFVKENAPPIQGYVLGSLVVIVIWLMLFDSRNMYAARRNVTLADELQNIVRVVILGMLIVMSAAFFYREFSYSRIVFGLLWGTAIVFIFTERFCVRVYERSLYRRGRHLQPAVIFGNNTVAGEVYQRLNQHASFGIAIAGYFADFPAESTQPLSAASYLGTLPEAPAFIREHRTRLGFIALQFHEHSDFLELVNGCEGVNIEFMMVPDMLGVLTSQVKVRELEGIPFLKIKGIPLTAWGRVTKRMFDLAVSALALLLLSPLLLVVMAAIKLDSRGPVLFRQQRVGLDGRPFTMYKFRSMRVGSEQFDAQAGLGLKNDPRRTRIGKILRSTSLDELPQLFNVLKGEMSLVGPRPERSRFVQEFGAVVPKYLDRHRVKTGVTGWAQVNGLRGDTSIEERVKYDLYYIENWSLAFDIKILLRTIRAVFVSRDKVQ
jgi:Undecaprenyl-phosphate glucose phosphotransferase